MSFSFVVPYWFFSSSIETTAFRYVVVIVPSTGLGQLLLGTTRTFEQTICPNFPFPADEEIARKILHLLDTCRQNDFSAADAEIVTANAQEQQTARNAGQFVAQDATLYDEEGAASGMENLLMSGGGPVGNDEEDSDDGMMDVEDPSQATAASGPTASAGPFGGISGSMGAFGGGISGSIGAFGGGISGSIGQTQKPEERTVDEDGFETVVRGGRRR